MFSVDKWRRNKFWKQTTVYRKQDSCISCRRMLA